MKRALEETTAGEPEAKVPRLSTPFPEEYLNCKWWFVTCGEDGASYHIHEWHPSRAEDPREAVRILLEAREKSRSLDEKYEPSMYMADVLHWARTREGTKPDGFPDLAPTFFGDFTTLAEGGDAGGMMHHGVTIYYSSWC